MSAVNKPIKIKVIDEDEEKGASQSEPKEGPKKAKKSVKKNSASKKTDTKKKTTAKKPASKKNAGKKSVKKTSKSSSSHKNKEKAAPVEIVENEEEDAEVLQNDELREEVDPEKMEKKEIVSKQIEEDEKDLLSGEDENSFAEKLKKELGEGERANVDDISQKVAIMGEAVDDLTGVNSNNTNSNLYNTGKEVNTEEDDEIQEIVRLRDRNSRSVGVYKRIAYFFMFLVIVMAAVITYFLFAKVTIVLVPDQERVSNNLIFDVRDSEASDGASRSGVEGVVRSIEIDHEKSYPSSGTEVIGKEAVGKVTIVNNYSKNQMLVATTRLLAVSGELFRTKNTVNVPAGGEVEVNIYADEPSPEMAIGPTKFNIPGLWAGLQDKIYAESKEDVVYQQKVKKHVVQSDIDNAIKDMRQQLLLKAKSEINKTYNDYDEIIYDLDDDSIESSIDAEVGDEIDDIVVNMDADVLVVAFEGEKSSELARQKFVGSLDDNKELLSFDNENIIYSLNNFNSNDGVATINATFEGKVSLKEDSDIIDKEDIFGLNSRQLEVYLGQLPDISGYEVRFQPVFLPDVLKKVPKLPERIEIQVKK